MEKITPIITAVLGIAMAANDYIVELNDIGKIITTYLGVVLMALSVILFVLRIQVKRLEKRKLKKELQ